MSLWSSKNVACVWPKWKQFGVKFVEECIELLYKFLWSRAEGLDEYPSDMAELMEVFVLIMIPSDNLYIWVWAELE